MGIYSLSHLPLDAVPDITDNQVQIITSSPDLSAQEVERFVTFPLEMEMGNIPNVEEIRSISRFGLSVITIVFKESVDIYWAREQINQKIQIARSEIPEGMGVPEMGPISTGLGEVYQYVIYPDEGFEEQYPPTELRSIQDWVIKRQLTGIPGVVEVNSSGGFLKQYAVAIDQNRLKAFGLSMEDVFHAVEQNNANAGGSYIEKSDQTYFIRGEGIINSISDLEQVVVKSESGSPILIRHIAEVKIDHAPRFGAVTMNGKGEVVAGQVMMLKGENSMEVTNRIKKRIEEIKLSLPEGVILEPYLDRSKLVNNTTRTVVKNLTEGALIVIFILVLLLGNLRAGLIVASVIPLSMLFAVSMMRLFGVSANLMSLGALDFGLIVDGAVIVVEAILHHLGKRDQSVQLSDKEKEAEVQHAASKIRTSAAFGEIIILIVYIPILLLEGVEGKMFIPMAQTVSFAILGAFILSTTYVPMMSALFLKNARTKETGLANRIIQSLYRLYAPLRDISLKIKYWVLLLTIAVFGLSLWTLSKMGGEFIPTLEEGDFALHQILPTGSSIKKGVEVSAQLQDILMSKFPEVEKVVTKIGTAEIPTDIMPLEAGDIFVIMKDKSEWVSASTREEMFEKMEEELNKFPGVMYEFTQPIQMRFNELMTGVRQDIAVKIYGEDLGILINKANEAKTILENIRGVGDIQVEATGGLQQMVVTYDRMKLAKYGISVAELNDILKTAFAGKVAGKFYEGERRFDVVLRLAQPFRQNIQSLEQLNVDLPSGGFVPMAELAKIEFQEGPAQISRDDTKRRIVIGVNSRNRDIASLITEIKSSFRSDLNLPAGYYIKYGGQFENLERARNRLAIVVPLALGLIFLLLFFTFKSFKQAILIFTAIPLSAIGGIWALYLRGMPMSISAGVGFIALFGVAVLNGIVLIAYFNQLKKEGMINIPEIIREGTHARLRPVVMTASVASLGFLPMALSHSAGAEVQRPLATVVIGGLITATFLTMIVLPILYELFEKIRVNHSRKVMMVIILCGFFSVANGQNLISLGEVLQLIENDQSRLASSIEYQKAALREKAKEPLINQPFQLSVSGEEFNFNGISGVESINLQKNFMSGKVRQGYAQLYGSQEKRLDNQLSLSNIQIKKEVSAIYIEAAYLKSLAQLETERREIYQEFLEVSKKRQEAGEASAIPVKRVTLRAEDIDIVLSEIKSKQILYAQLLNSWLKSKEYEVDALENISMAIQSGDDHPAIQFFTIEKEILREQSKVVKNQGLPMWFTAARLQRINGQTLFFGYQVGVQFPFARQYVERQQNALTLQASAYDEQQKWVADHMTRDRSNYEKLANANADRIDKIRNHLLEHEALTTDIIRAYRFGELGYTDVITHYDDYFNLHREKLELMKEMLLNQNQYIHYTNH